MVGFDMNLKVCACVCVSYSDRSDHWGRVCVPVSCRGRRQDSESRQLGAPRGVR